MEFRIKSRSDPGRIGEILVENKKITTPNIFFVDTERFKAPKYADLLLVKNNDRREKISLRVLEKKYSNSRESEKGKLNLKNHFFYPKDLPKEIHVSALKLYKKNKENCYLIPGNNEVIDEAVKENPAVLYIVANAGQLFRQPKNFVDYIVKLRKKIGYQKMIYLPAVGNLDNLSLLKYLGIDLFDNISSILAAREDKLFFSDGTFDKNELEELPCSCPICKKYKANPDQMKFNDILEHNQYIVSEEIRNIRNHIRLNKLRSLVEKRSINSPHLTTILRYLDDQYYDFLEKRTSINRGEKILATTRESCSRVEIKRFQKRVLDRYQKPSSAKILLLLPCSAKKPYSFSKSHSLFKKALKYSKNPNVIHEMVITSPLGLVPRELELIYPASSYDIPVTGIWYEDEKKMIRRLLSRYLEANNYDKIINHLPPRINDFISDILENEVYTCKGHPTSKDSIKKLSETLRENVKPYKYVKKSSYKEEYMNCSASYQFGGKISEKLLDNCDIKGRYPYYRIMYENEQMGMIAPERNLISLTLEGGKKIEDSEKYWVEIYDDFTLKGSVFAPGIKNAYRSIRRGDEVLVKQAGDICGVGEAKMNGEEMMDASYGEAVKVRHTK